MGKINYRKYIKSTAWREKADAFKAKAGHRCESCGSNFELHIHHMTYRNLGNETWADVKVLCKQCHFYSELGHNKEKWRFSDRWSITYDTSDLRNTKTLDEAIDLYAAIAQLDTNTQSTLLSWAVGYTLREVASFFGLTANGIRRRIVRSLPKLKFLMGD